MINVSDYKINACSSVVMSMSKQSRISRMLSIANIKVTHKHLH